MIVTLETWWPKNWVDRLLLDDQKHLFVVFEISVKAIWKNQYLSGLEASNFQPPQAHQFHEGLA